MSESPRRGLDERVEGSLLPGGGTVWPIVRWGDTVMHHKLEPIEVFDDGLRELVADMAATMYAADGVGLAACQIGRDLAVFVFDCPDEDGNRHQGVVCNPELFLPVGKDRKLDDGDEGCLSLPGAFVPCARPTYARVEGQGIDGSPVRYAGTVCWPGACSTRPTTATASCSATGSASGCARSCSSRPTRLPRSTTRRWPA